MLLALQFVDQITILGSLISSLPGACVIAYHLFLVALALLTQSGNRRLAGGQALTTGKVIGLGTVRRHAGKWIPGQAARESSHLLWTLLAVLPT